MGSYIPSTLEDRTKMLETIGLNSCEGLFDVIPKAIKVGNLNIPSGKSEMEVERILTDISNKNIRYQSIYRGAGAYNHYIPSVVSSIISKERFLTAYTPYQAEISQGILQSIFEYQTMICELTGMYASNASVYDGATAAAEAISMCNDRKRRTTLVADTVNPMTITTIRTYCEGNNTRLIILKSEDGKIDINDLYDKVDENVASVYIQSPNYYGMVEDVVRFEEIIHSKGAKLIMGINPIAAAIYKTPAEYGADIAVGEGQPLGMPLAFGGPYLGFMASNKDMMRKLPGRIVGETKDGRGHRAYVLTLQAREQHIRREKATSNICSNQALCAMTAATYMATMGPSGMMDVANSCRDKAHYMADELTKINGISMAYRGEFFHEFVTTIDGDVDKIIFELEKMGILGGLPISKGILWCVTEVNLREDIDRLVRIVREVLG